MTIHVMGDLDDVFFPWADAVHEACRVAGLHDGSKPCNLWHMWENYGCAKEDWLAVVDQASADGLYTDTEPFPGTVQAWNRLKWEFGDDVQLHLVTARGFMANAEHIREATPVWVEEYGIAHDTLTFAKDKVAAMVTLTYPYRFDYAIDDGVHNFDALDKVGVNVYLQTRPHNLTHPTTKRVDHVSDFVDIILKETL